MIFKYVADLKVILTVMLLFSLPMNISVVIAMISGRTPCCTSAGYLLTRQTLDFLNFPLRLIQGFVLA